MDVIIKWGFYDMLSTDEETWHDVAGVLEEINAIQAVRKIGDIEVEVRNEE